jgi:hypothetical protein
MNESERPRRAGTHYLLFASILLIGFHAGMFWKSGDAIHHRIIPFDGDGYWHLLRVEKLYKTHEWYDLSLSRSNAPYGEKIHWTKAFDLLLFAGAVIASPLITFREALYWWGVFINPVLHLLALFALAWSVRPLLGSDNASLIGYLFPFQLFTALQFGVGRPDHHGLMLCLFVLLLGATLRLIIAEPSRAWCFSFGAIASIAVWAGIESLVAVFLSLIFLGLAWVCYRRSFGHQNLHMSLAMLFTAALTLILNDPISEFFKVELDRSSIVHLSLWGLIALFWVIAIFLERGSRLTDRPKKRLVIVLAGAFACIILMYNVFPKFFDGPTADVDPEVKAVYLSQVSEFKPLFSQCVQFPNGIKLSWGLTLLALPSSIIFFLRSSGQKRFAWAFITLLTLAYISLPMYQMRWLSYAQLVSIIPLSQLLGKILQWEGSKIKKPLKPFVRCFTILIFCGSPILILLFPNSAKQVSLLQQPDYRNSLCLYLNDRRVFGNRPMRILTRIDLGPYILYKTKHEVIGTPAHRNERGILDTFAVWNAKDNETAHQIINNRGINVILIERPEKALYQHLISDPEIALKFYFRLWHGSVPDWLNSLPVPISLDQKVKAFRVKY